MGTGFVLRSGHRINPQNFKEETKQNKKQNKREKREETNIINKYIT